MIKSFFWLFIMSATIFADPVADREQLTIDVNNTVIESNISEVVAQEAHIQKLPSVTSESDFSKASLPMKVFYVVAVPVVMVGAVVYYAVIAPFALVRWAVEGKK